MKICITGAHSTGKTTLINTFVDAYPQFKCLVIKEKAREVIEEGHVLGKHATIDSYLYYINEQLKAEIESDVEAYDILLADRSIIDGLAHPIVNSQFGYSKFPQFFLELFQNILHFQKSFFDLYLYIPIEFDMVEDAVRPNDEPYRKAIDKEIKTLLEKNISNFAIIKGDLNQRVQAVFNKINT